MWPDPNIADNIYKANFMMLSKLLMEEVLIDTAQTRIYATALCPKMTVYMHRRMVPAFSITILAQTSENANPL